MAACRHLLSIASPGRERELAEAVAAAAGCAGAAPLKLALLHLATPDEPSAACWRSAAEWVAAEAEHGGGAASASAAVSQLGAPSGCSQRQRLAHVRALVAACPAVSTLELVWEVP